MKKLIIVILASILSTACYWEVKNQTEVWACKNIEQGPVCYDTGIRILIVK